jgi:hypothetical protein
VEDILSLRIPLLSTYFHVFLHSSAGTIDLSAVYRWTGFGDVLFTAVIRPFVTLEDKANARRIIARFLAINYSKPTKRSLFCQVNDINDQIDATVTIVLIFE